MNEDVKNKQTAEEKPQSAVETEPKQDAEPDRETSKKDAKKLKRQLDEAEKSLKAAETDVEKAKAGLKESNDKFLRLYAEFDNYKKRTAKETDAIYSNAYADAVKELLPVFDNLERAADYASDEASKNGLNLIITNFLEVLKKMGIEQFGAAGDAFDANLHSAVMHIDDEKLGENVIAAVFQKGYKKGDKIIRYATVQVAN